TDAVQAVGNLPIDVEDLNIDLLSLSGHKINGPKGVGALYIRKGVNISNILHGGGQEMRRRAGTENVAGIVGLGKAIEVNTKDIEKKSKYLIELRDYFIERILKTVPDTILNGDPKLRLPGNINVCFKYIEGESILLMLDIKGICASSGSACTSGSLEPSHVLLALGLPHEIAHGSLRLTLSEENTKDDMDYVLETIPPIIEKLRAMSPLIKK
ncbi:MAG: aminotransferase class V-fold PLP-dependent enzyme, partial [Candidatus Dojkabacteria bacterium]|nr:aminotransferase class V-fold PLP-dependent enzyme [Candidatus Dojkabacteria bacterium]